MANPTWLDYAGFMFNVLATAAGLFGLFLAIKAYKVGVQAYGVSAESYRVSKEQGRKTFEVEALRELMVLIQDPRVHRAIVSEPRGAFFRHGITVRIKMLPEKDLPSWHRLSMCWSLPQSREFAPGWLGPPEFFYPHQEGLEVTEELELGNILSLLHSEALEAMRKRIE